jgi:nucleotide-binding universal stress UspA family protein
MIEKVLVPIDDSPQAAAALAYTLEEFPDGDITVLHVIEVPGSWSAFERSFEDFPGYNHQQQEATKLLDAAQRKAADAGVDIESETVTGEPAREIIRTAQNGAFDQIVIGTHGRHGVSRVLFGSVAEAVTRRSNVPVVVVT